MGTMEMMDTHDAMERRIPPADIRELLLENAVERARQEHEELREALVDMYEQVCLVRAGAEQNRLNRELRKLRELVKQFRTKWEAHIRWEESELFPYSAWYFGEDPDLFDYMEQEYELADQYLQAFLHTIDRSVIPIQAEEARRMTSYLMQAYAFLKNRFEEEEEILTALTDRSNSYNY